MRGRASALFRGFSDGGTPSIIDFYPVTGAAKLSPHEAADKIKASNAEVIRRINEFTEATFRTRGGRMGSGMGLLLEGLWGYHMSAVLEPFGIEIAWIAEDQYNDYACADMAEDWDPDTREGELLRVEAKTMNLGADEIKGHFAELASNIGEDDLLLVLVWRWTSTDSTGLRVWPKVEDVFVDRARPLAELRDALHIARGGSFVDRDSCPDGCTPSLCQHHGEPLNASGKRERLQGPESTRPSAKVSFAANFGGLKRMLGVRGAVAERRKRELLRAIPEANAYDNFMRRALQTP